MNLLIIGVFIGSIVTLLIQELLRFIENRNARGKTIVQEDDPRPVMVCDAKVYTNSNSNLDSYTNVVAITTHPKNGVVVSLIDGNCYQILGWSQVETTPWHEYVEENLGELASVLVGKDDQTDPVIDAMLEYKGDGKENLGELASVLVEEDDQTDQVIDTMLEYKRELSDGKEKPIGATGRDHE